MKREKEESGARGSATVPRKWILFLILLGLAEMGKGVSPLRAEVKAARTSSCIVCHSKIRAEYRGSIHAAAGLSCVDCHGGDPNDMEETAMSPAAGFRGHPSRSRIPEFCASCHAKRDLMRPYGLPADQYSEYQTSPHGQALAKGDTRVAVCTDCHTSHHILPPDNPLSAVAPMNLPRTCARCHADRSYMAPYNLPTNQLDQFVGSVHGQALLEGQNRAAPNCASCHGSHGARPPDVAHLDLVCGRCHGNMAEAFRASVHHRPAAAGRMSPCTGCHQHHAIQRPTSDLLTASCGRCHELHGKVRELSRQLRSMLDNARQDLEKSRAAVKAAAAAGLEVTELQFRLEEAHTHLLQAAVVQHTLIPYRVERETRAVESISRDTLLVVQEMQERLRLRRWLLLPVWSYLLFNLGLLALKRRRVERERKASGRSSGEA